MRIQAFALYAAQIVDMHFEGVGRGFDVPVVDDKICERISRCCFGDSERILWASGSAFFTATSIPDGVIFGASGAAAIAFAD